MLQNRRNRARNRPTFWIQPSKFSNSALALAEILGNDARVIRHKNSKYQPHPNDIVINWGNSNPRFPVRVNNGQAVSIAISKLNTFEVLGAAGVRIPEFTTSKEQAILWAERGRLLGRDIDRGSQGGGITVYAKGSQIGNHRFYVRYVRKDREFRVHVWQGQVIFEQEKLKKNNVEADKYIRSHDRGWIFAFNHLQENPVPELVKNEATRAVAALNLDFGAVDIAWSARSGATVLEINTAPGIENSSLEAYRDAILRLRR